MMSVHLRTTESLTKTLRASVEGFIDASVCLRQNQRPDLAQKLGSYASQRSQFCDDLETLTSTHEADVTVPAATGRVLRSSSAGGDGYDAERDVAGVLQIVGRAEQDVLDGYTIALGADVSPRLHSMIKGQFEDVKKANNELAMLYETTLAEVENIPMGGWPSA